MITSRNASLRSDRRVNRNVRTRACSVENIIYHDFASDKHNQRQRKRERLQFTLGMLVGVIISTVVFLSIMAFYVIPTTEQAIYTAQQIIKTK